MSRPKRSGRTTQNGLQGYLFARPMPPEVFAQPWHAARAEALA